jgi:hypothetical protein
VSSEDLWKVVGRARCDLDFGGQLRQNFAKTVAEAGYNLDPRESFDAHHAVEQLLLDPLPGPAGPQPPSNAELEAMRKLRLEQLARMSELTEYMFATVKKTFLYAGLTYKSVTWMNWLTFGTGIALFVFAAFYAVYSQEKVYSLLFGGLGVSSFVALFILGPIDKTQGALSHLVQTEIAFMNYFDQQTFWESYANIGPANIERASASLQGRAQETIELLRRHLDEEDARRRRGRHAKKEPEAPPARA